MKRIITLLCPKPRLRRRIIKSIYWVQNKPFHKQLTIRIGKNSMQDYKQSQLQNISKFSHTKKLMLGNPSRSARLRAS